jgi:hypothetical protein
MEIIPLAGYTEDEKAEIASQHLISQADQGARAEEGRVQLTDEALTDMIRYYTREAGVRNLEREIAKLARKAVTRDRQGRDQEGRGDADRLRTSSACRAPLRPGREGGPGRRRHRAGLDVGRRRSAADRGAEAARQGADEDDRQARRRDEGIDRRGVELRPLDRAATSG